MVLFIELTTILGLLFGAFIVSDVTSLSSYTAIHGLLVAVQSNNETAQFVR